MLEAENALGSRLTQMDKQELCSVVSALCRAVVAEVGSRGRRGGIYPDNISVGPGGAVSIGPAGKSPWTGQELNFVAPELYWNGQLSAASDVYSVGLVMYYAVSGGKLPLEDECEDAQLRRMSGGNPKAPKSAGVRLGAIIEKCLRFKPSERYQTLEELRAVVDSCVKDLYLGGVPSSEAIFRKEEKQLSDVERMMVGIIERSEDLAIENSEEYPTEEPEDGVKVYTPPAKGASPAKAAPEQAQQLGQKMAAASSPAAPRHSEDLAPVTLQRSSPAVQYKLKTERERKIAEEVKKRRRRPIAVIIVLCAVLVMVAIIFNAMYKDYEQASTRVDNIVAPTPDPYAQPESTSIPYEAFNTATPGPSITMEPVEIPEGVEIPAEHGYQVFKDDCGWTEAQKKCEAMGGHLVVVDDEEELEEVIRLAEEAGITRVWLGCHRDNNGTYLWEGKDPYGFSGYFRWAAGEPTYTDTNDRVAENYIMLWNNRGWAYNDNRDDPCHDYPAYYSGSMGYVCEFND